MAERVHPAAPEPANQPQPNHSESDAKSKFDSGEHSNPRSSPTPSYVIQIPKDTIYRVPPPENARLYKNYSRPKRGCSFCRVLCWFVFFLILLAIAAAVAAAVLYFVLQPKAPSYSIDSLSVKGFNVSQTLIASPEFDVSVRAENRNKKIGIFYETGSSVYISCSGQQLVSGQLPTFYQGTQNVTVFVTALTGSNVQLTSTVRDALIQGQNNGRVSLYVSIDAPIKLKVGSVKTWKFTVKVRCDVTVDKLTADATVVSKDCAYSVKW
ncbi:NDR1/HIN1-like protein 13 [Nymphaea colorata]|uniref:Late embryogenesis abundant protein LEA-2 subgroup domain-containing protein n=1 Tax=Nymphaea colorata TaxID=210225 RepID=A0A5K0W880_9MAGN|nr:NDR1/HIN1-like protein 13 [Nymphaea colorata]